MRDEVLSVLTHEPKTIGEICGAMRTESTIPHAPALRKTLKQLRAEGIVVTTGQRRGMRYSLPTMQENDNV